jgi:D-3-phosphoglycerate dehydrogenase
MAEIRTYDAIDPEGLAKLSEAGHTYGPDIERPDAIILRSHALQMDEVPDSVRAIFRAGAGVNTIPVDEATELGIAVCNTPGENATAVAEFVVGSMIALARNMFPAERFVRGLDPSELSLVEGVKKQFAGFEVAGKRLGVIGLGEIGVRFANKSLGLGMDVVGYDGFIDVRNAHRLSHEVQLAEVQEEALSGARVLSVHVPLNLDTRGMIGAPQMELLAPGAVLLNFSRGGIVNDEEAIKALNKGLISRYATDFPTAELLALKRDDVVIMPHLGASTVEAETNCSLVAAEQINAFFARGRITTSVNFAPNDMPWSGDVRAVVLHRDEPGALSHITVPLGAAGLNIANNSTRPREATGLASTLIDIDADDVEAAIQVVGNIDVSDGQIFSVRTIRRPQ